LLNVKQVSKVYENQRGVHNIDFTMSRGEIVGFLGPNGAGKTTTMRMITGYLNPTKGEILIDGQSMADHPREARRKIGYLPETPPLYPEMTVTSYLKFVANLRDVPVREQKKRIGEVIEKLGLQGREKQVIRSLSKGYRQRVGLAQAILHKPDLLIMDEPTSGLDPKQIIEIRDLIRELGQNHTVLLSTHILPEVNAICNRVLIINHGKIVLDAAPDSVSGAMNRPFEVRLQVKGPKDDVIREIRSLNVVSSVKEVRGLSTVKDPGAVDLHVVSKDRNDIREALFYRLAEKGFPILEMQKESLSLEEVFLKLTSDEKPAGSGESSGEKDEPEVNAHA
jgi:ABC-2 type transport system ATP-binding protein